MIIPKWIKRPVDFFVTISLWIYFTLGFCLFFSPFYFFSYLFSKNPENSFQKLNQRFLKSFFTVLKIITPRLKINIDAEVCSIRSSVILCNHISLLDPILLVSLFEKHKTIIKKTFLKVPIFGRLVKTSGYLFPTVDETSASFLLEQVENLENFLLSKGNLFIFPEGTRSRDGKIGRLKKGAFSLARHCKAPIQVLLIKNTNQLFTPGKWLLNTCVANTIEVKRIMSLEPDYTSDTFSIQALIAQVSQALENQHQT